MKILKDILYKAGLVEVLGSTNIAITHITFNSREVKRDSLFVAVRGTTTDGHKYIKQAEEAGAIAIVCEEIPEDFRGDINYIKVENSAEALGIIASNFYDNPSENLKLVGITGTNGKTTSVTLLFNLFRKLGYNVGLLSTVVNKINETEIPSTHTTPDPVNLNKLLAEMVAFGCEYCFMEVSSHAVDQRRIAGLQFAVAGFTNLSHDHLDYHKTFKDYLLAKKRFFDELNSDAIAITNIDDKNGNIMLQNTKATIKRYALFSDADFKAKLIESHFSGLLINVDGEEIWSKLVGTFNAYNLLLVYAIARSLEVEKLEALQAISSLEAVEGRFEYFKTTIGVTVIVDYAHTPDALENVLKSIKNLRTGNEKLITIVGCGGNRDAAKRPLMSNIACQFSNKVIITSDNPRNEDPNDIIADMMKGVEPIDFKKTLSLVDRKDAIKTAGMIAEEGDIILIAGKGHEKYQEINGVKHPFDDLAIAKELIN